MPWGYSPSDEPLLFLAEMAARLVTVAAAFYLAHAKRRRVWLWCPLGYVTIFALFVLVLLPDVGEPEPVEEPPVPPDTSLDHLHDRLRREREFLALQRKAGEDEETLFETEIWIDELERRIKARLEDTEPPPPENRP